MSVGILRCQIFTPVKSDGWAEMATKHNHGHGAEGDARRGDKSETHNLIILSSEDDVHQHPITLSGQDDVHHNPITLSSQDDVHKKPITLFSEDVGHHNPITLSSEDVVHHNPITLSSEYIGHTCKSRKWSPLLWFDIILIMTNHGWPIVFVDSSFGVIRHSDEGPRNELQREIKLAKINLLNRKINHFKQSEAV